MFTQGSSARLTPATKDAPVDAVIVGIVDVIEVGGNDIGEAINDESGTGDCGHRARGCGEASQPDAAAAGGKCSGRTFAASNSSARARWRLCHRG
jgi:hypothetical protein